MSPARVLIVDDNVDIAKVLGALVEHCGHIPRIVHDAKSSLEASREFQPHVALLDIGLPDMNGYELAGLLRAQRGLENMLIVALTGYAQEEDRQRAKEAGFDIHLVKPVTIDALQQVLDQARR
jgi:CheY-like chemotaxis protein